MNEQDNIIPHAIYMVKITIRHLKLIIFTSFNHNTFLACQIARITLNVVFLKL